MDISSIFKLAIQYGPIIKNILDEASTNDAATQKIKIVAPSLTSVLANLGAELFPKAAPELHVLAAATASFDPNVTKWLQKALNNLVVPSPNLVVDGDYGKLTRAAVEALQAKLGLAVDGFAGQITQAAIQSLLLKLS